MRIQLSVSRRDEGAVAVIVSILAVVLIVVAAFTTDFGMAYAQRQALSTGADSGALAVVEAKYADLIANPARTCISLAGSTGKDMDPASMTRARAQVEINKPFNETINADDVSTDLECVGANNGTLQVTVSVAHWADPILGSVLGASKINVGQTAVAALGVANKVKSLPIAICQTEANLIEQADLAPATKGVAQLVPLDKVWPSGTGCNGGGGSGNWGWLNFGEGVSTQDLVDYINGTYPTTVTLPIPPMDGTPGDKGNGDPVVNAMQTIMGQTVNLPVYDSVTGSGANTKYNITGFLAVKMCGYRDNNKQATDAAPPSGCYDNSAGVKLTDNTIQIRFAQFIRSTGKISDLCAVGSACSFNAFVYGLVR